MADVTLPMELYDSRETEHARGRTSTGRRQWLCSWEGRYDVVTEGRSKYTDGINAADYCEQDDRLICVRVHHKGVGAGKTVGGVTLPFDGAVVTAQYADVQQLVLGYQDAAPDDHYESSQITIPAGQGRVYEDGTVVDDLVPMQITLVHWTTRRFFVASRYLRQSILDARDKVNSMQFGEYPAQTLKFDGARINHRLDPETGLLIMEVTYQFTSFPPGWNRNWVNGRWQLVSPPIYATTNFNLLLGAGVVIW